MDLLTLVSYSCILWFRMLPPLVNFSYTANLSRLLNIESHIFHPNNIACIWSTKHSHFKRFLYLTRYICSTSCFQVSCSRLASLNLNDSWNTQFRLQSHAMGPFKKEKGEGLQPLSLISSDQGDLVLRPPFTQFPIRSDFFYSPLNTLHFPGIFQLPPIKHLPNMTCSHAHQHSLSWSNRVLQYNTLNTAKHSKIQ